MSRSTSPRTRLGLATLLFCLIFSGGCLCCDCIPEDECPEGCRRGLCAPSAPGVKVATMAVTIADAVRMSMTRDWQNSCDLEGLCSVDGEFSGECRRDGESGLQVLEVTASCGPSAVEVRLHWSELLGGQEPDMLIEVDLDDDGRILSFVRRPDRGYVDGEGYRPIRHEYQRTADGSVQQLRQCFLNGTANDYCLCDEFRFEEEWGAYPVSVASLDTCTSDVLGTEQYVYEAAPTRIRRREIDRDSDRTVDVTVLFEYDDANQVVVIEVIEAGDRSRVPVGGCCPEAESCGGTEVSLPDVPEAI